MKSYIIAHNTRVVQNVSKYYDPLGDYSFIFVGHRVDESLTSINSKPAIVANYLKYNIETFPWLVAYTAWFALVENNFIEDDEWYGIFEYDVRISDDFLDKVKPHLQEGNMIGFIPFSVDHILFAHGTKYLQKSLMKIYGIDVNTIIKKELFLDRRLWNSTTNCVILGKDMKEFTKWFFQLVPEFDENPNAAHVHERALRVWMSLKNINPIYVPNVLKHFQMKSHKIEADII